MAHVQDHISESVSFIRQKSAIRPDIALILGSGLGDFADTLEKPNLVLTSAIPHYPRSTVIGHRGAIVLGHLRGKPIAAFQGRVHLYESGSVETVRYPVRTAYTLGARTLIVTNAAGGINRGFLPGDLMLITDQINFIGRHTTVSTPGNVHRLRFYDPDLIQRAAAISAGIGIRIQQGIYAGMRGPSYETGAEVEMLHRLGADAVGMSTVLEVDMAASLGMTVLGISCITNKATGVGSQKLSHDEVTIVASRVKANFTRLLTEIIDILQT